MWLFVLLRKIWWWYSVICFSFIGSCNFVQKITYYHIQISFFFFFRFTVNGYADKKYKRRIRFLTFFLRRRNKFFSVVRACNAMLLNHSASQTWKFLMYFLYHHAEIHIDTEQRLFYLFIFIYFFFTHLINYSFSKKGA